MTSKKSSPDQCYAVGDVLDSSNDWGQLNGTSIFGLDIAEKVIFEHYVAITNGASFLEAILSEVDWPDHGGKRNYCDMLSARNRHVSLDRLLARRMQWPDIVTHNGVASPAVPSLASSLVLFPQPVIPRRPNLPRGRYEYYEIKPDSPSGRSRGEAKMANIASVYHDFGLPYKPGVVYPPYGIAQIPLPVNRLFVVVCGTLLARHGIRDIRLWLRVRRSADGLLLYKVCVEMETDDQRQKRILVKALTKHVMAAYVYCLAPERFKDLEVELGDTSYEGQPVPRVLCRFDVVEPLKPYTSSIGEAIFQRGLGLPGQEFLLVCDEVAYHHLVPIAVPTVESLWAELRQRAERWAYLYAGRGGVELLEREVLAKVEKIARLVDLLIPGLNLFANAVLRWMSEHPYLTVALVVIPVVVTGGLAVAIDAGLLAGGVFAAAEMSAGELVGVNVIGGVGRAALPQLLVEATSGAEIATATASRGLAMTFEEVALAQLGGPGVAANTTSAALPQLAIAMAKAAPVVKSAAVAAGGIAVLTFSTQAYAGGSTPPARSSADGEQEHRGAAPDTNPQAARRLIAEVTSGVYMVEALASPRARRPLVKGDRINIHDYGQTRDISELSRYPETPPPLRVRYLGRINLR